MANADRKSLTKYSVEFPLSGSTGVLMPMVEIRQSQGSHDVAVVSYGGKLDNMHKSFTTGAPVKIRWSNRWGSNQFVGYVHHVRAHFGSDNYTSDVVCVGASFPLISVKQRSFTNVTADLVVRKIAMEHGLRAVTEPHPRIYETVLQPTISDWALLCRLAKETGYVLRANQTRIEFLSRATFEAQNKPMAQILTMTSGVSNSTSTLSTMFDFDPIIGDYLPEIGVSNTRKSVRAVDPATGQTVSLERGLGLNDVSGIFTKPVDTVTNSIQDAQASLDATVEASRFTYRARVSSVGSPVTSPDKMVYLKGLPNPYEGYWTVLSVVHRITDTSRYLMDFQVGSDLLRGAEPQPASGLSEAVRDNIVARDVGQYQTLRSLTDDSTLNTIPGDYEGFIGRAFTGAVWQNTTLVEV